MNIALRHRAGVDALGLQGGESVLEIGCGHGVATRLLLSALPHGHVVALDRSPKMIATLLGSTDRQDRLEVHAAPIEKMDFGSRRFDGILAINVELNLRLGDVWAPMLVKLLAQSGRIVLAFEAPSTSKAELFAVRSRQLLEAEGLRVTVAAREEGRERVTVIAANRL